MAIRKTPILLARHGQTDANVENWISGWRDDVDLTGQGVLQAEELGRRLAEVHQNGQPIAGILCSDLHRARRTAELANQFLHLPVVHHPGLRERNYGDWTGRPYQELGRDPKAWKKTAKRDQNRPLWHDESWAPPGGETLAQLRTRAVDAVERGVTQWAGQRFLIISHRGTLRVLMQHRRHLAYQDTPSPPDPPNFMTLDWPC